jgi:hypothetical protein
MNMAFNRVYSWNIVSLNFEFLLILNHDDVTWDCLKKEYMEKRKGIPKHTIWRRVRGAIRIL